MLAQPTGGAGGGLVSQTSQLRFVGPAGMVIGWKAGNAFAENQLVAPGRFDFVQGGTYQLKVTGVPGREGLVLYPTIQIRPADPSTDPYLSHNSVPIEISDEDLDQVESNNFVTKVIYLPDARHQELAIAGVETLVSTRLDPGVDPVAEAGRRGTVMAVLRMGNKDLEMPGALGAVRQASHAVFDGNAGQFVQPVPISVQPSGVNGVPRPMIVGGAGAPGQPPYPVAGMGAIPVWGMPSTSTPIGLPGPPHLPFGGPAALKSHTMRNLTHNHMPKPVNDLLIDVKHTPGYSMPQPVRHIQYSEKHPVFRPGEVSYPAHSLPSVRH